jgi:hypothetical protein
MEVSRKTRALLMRLIVDFEDQRTDSVRFSREGTTLVVPLEPKDSEALASAGSLSDRKMISALNISYGLLLFPNETTRPYSDALPIRSNMR